MDEFTARRSSRCLTIFAEYATGPDVCAPAAGNTRPNAPSVNTYSTCATRPSAASAFAACTALRELSGLKYSKNAASAPATLPAALPLIDARISFSAFRAAGLISGPRGPGFAAFGASFVDTHRAPALARPMAAAIVEVAGTVSGTTRIVDRAGVLSACGSRSGAGASTRRPFRCTADLLLASADGTDEAERRIIAPVFFGRGRVEGAGIACCATRTPYRKSHRRRTISVGEPEETAARRTCEEVSAARDASLARPGEVKVRAWRRRGSVAEETEREEDGEVVRENACQVPECTREYYLQYAK